MSINKSVKAVMLTVTMAVAVGAVPATMTAAEASPKEHSKEQRAILRAIL